MLKQLSSFAIAGVAATITTFAANPAEAVVVTVGDTNYDISTVDGTFNDLESQLTATPWFGNQTLAGDIADAVGDSFGTVNVVSSGLPTAPLFAFAQDNQPFFPVSVAAFSPAFNFTISNGARVPNNQTFTFATTTGTATPVPEPLTIFGTVVALGFGAKFKQKASKSA